MTPAKYNKKYFDIFAPDGLPYDIQPDNIERIRSIQNKIGADNDGYLGPDTIEKIAKYNRVLKCSLPSEDTPIVIGPKNYDLDNVPTTTWFEDFEWGHTNSRIRKRNVKQIIIHYDVSFSAQKTEQILEERGYSTHFIIDGNKKGSLYQSHDPATKVTLHAGKPNEYSIGIDLNNPADIRYQKADEDKRGRKREIKDDKIHGKNIKRLSYFEEQLNTLQKLLSVLCNVFDVPKKHPQTEDGETIKTKLDNPSQFEGILGHYHWDLDKTDPAPLNWQSLIDGVD